MSMTENEAIEYLKHMVCCLLGESSVDDADFEHIQEKYVDREIIKAYRIIAETFDDFKAYKKATEEFVQKQFWEAMDICKAYRAIGTIEECRTAVERMKNIQSVIDSVRETCYQMGLDESQAEILTDGIKEKFDWSE